MSKLLKFEWFKVFEFLDSDIKWKKLIGQTSGLDLPQLLDGNSLTTWWLKEWFIEECRKTQVKFHKVSNCFTRNKKALKCCMCQQFSVIPKIFLLA